jgi:hypothetical protein
VTVPSTPLDPDLLLAGPRARRLLAELIEIRQVDGWSATALSGEFRQRHAATVGTPDDDSATAVAAGRQRSYQPPATPDRMELAHLVRVRATERAAALSALKPGDTRVLAAIIVATWLNFPWMQPDPNDQLLADPAIAAALRPAAEALAAAEVTAAWNAPLAVRLQRLTLFDLPDWEGAPPGADHPLEFLGLDAWDAAWRAAMGASAWDRVDWTVLADEHSRGAWWSAPIGPWWSGEEPRRPGGAPVTTLPLDFDTEHPVGSAGLVWLEASPAAEGALLVPVSPARPPRIYEVTGPESWAALVRQFPADVSASRSSGWYSHTGRDGAWAVPDWAVVRESYDAVHVTVAGYLTTAGRAVEVGDGVATVLAGWAPRGNSLAHGRARRDRAARTVAVGPGAAGRGRPRLASRRRMTERRTASTHAWSGTAASTSVWTRWSPLNRSGSSVAIATA